MSAWFEAKPLPANPTEVDLRVHRQATELAADLGAAMDRMFAPLPPVDLSRPHQGLAALTSA